MTNIQMNKFSIHNPRSQILSNHTHLRNTEKHVAEILTVKHYTWPEL